MYSCKSYFENYLLHPNTCAEFCHILDLKSLSGPQEGVLPGQLLWQCCQATLSACACATSLPLTLMTNHLIVMTKQRPNTCRAGWNIFQKSVFVKNSKMCTHMRCVTSLPFTYLDDRGICKDERRNLFRSNSCFCFLFCSVSEIVKSNFHQI